MSNWTPAVRKVEGTKQIFISLGQLSPRIHDDLVLIAVDIIVLVRVAHAQNTSQHRVRAFIPVFFSTGVV